MVKGKKAPKWVSADDVLQATSGGYDVYMHYLGKVARQMDRPWGKKEKKSSWGIFPYSGVWFWKDQATEESGNAISFVERHFNLTYNEAKDKIAWAFGLGGSEGKVQILWDRPYSDNKEYTPIKFTKKHFGERHHAFWNIAQVTESDCEKKNCFAVKDLAIKGKRVYIGKDEVVFAFYAPEEDAVKIYFPERDKSERFRNNVSYHYLWNFSSLGNCTDLIIQKSPKDMIVTTMVTPCVTATQAEAEKIFNEETVERINSISTTPWIWYGSDGDGVKKCQGITGTHGYRYINTEKKYLPEVNDVYSLVKMFNTQKMGTGLQELESFMKKKGLL